MDSNASSLLQSLLTPTQQEKWDRVCKYLALTIPNEWRTLQALDAELSFGAQMCKFPWDWIAALKEATKGGGTSSNQPENSSKNSTSDASSSTSFGLQMRLPSLESGLGKEGIALRYYSLKYANKEQLVMGLNAPDAGNTLKAITHAIGQKRQRANSRSAGDASTLPSTFSSSAPACVGTNTLYVCQSDAVTEAVIKDAIASNTVMHVLNTTGGRMRALQQLRSMGGSGAGGGDAGAEDDEGGGGGGGMRSLDGGRGRLQQWLTQAPIGILRSSTRTLRGVMETSYGASAVPLRLCEGEEMKMRIQRQDDPNRQRYAGGVFVPSARPTSPPAAAASAGGGGLGIASSAPPPPTLPFSYPKGSRVMLSILVNDQIPDGGSHRNASVPLGLRVVPSTVAFDMDSQTVDILWSAQKRGMYTIKLSVSVTQPTPPDSAAAAEPYVYECSFRIFITETFAYSNGINRHKVVEADKCPLRSAPQPGGVVMCAHSLFPLPLPKQYCLSTFAADATLAPPQQVLHCVKERERVKAMVAQQQQQQQQQGAAVSASQNIRPPPLPSRWFSDVSPHTLALAERRPGEADLRGCASLIMSGPLLFSNASLDPSAQNRGADDSKDWDASYRDADGNLDPAKVQAKLQADAREKGEKAKEAAASRLRKRRENRELTNKHLLNFGIDLRKPLRKK